MIFNIWYIMVGIGIMLAMITIGIIRATHLKIYKDFELVEEGDWYCPLWAGIIIFIIGVVPILNVLMFTVFMLLYIPSYAAKPMKSYSIASFSLNEGYLITTIFNKIRKFLNRK